MIDNSKRLEAARPPRQRKEWKRGTGSTQKMVSFRLDADLIPLLENVENKGRLINNLLREFLERATH